MREWILPSNPKYFKIEDAFRELKIIDWHQSNNLNKAEKGDVVYIYSSAPNSRILYKGAILEVNKPEPTIDDSLYSIPVGNIAEGRSMEVALFREYELDGLDIKSLQANGLTSNLQCPVTVGPVLANYLHSKDNKQREVDRFMGSIPSVCLVPFPLKIDEGTVDIHVPLSPESISENGKEVVCRACGSTFMKAPRCTICGQKIAYNDAISSEEISDEKTVLTPNQTDINYSEMLSKIKQCEDKKELHEVFREYGFRTPTSSTETKGTNDLYIQFADGSRLHFQKRVFTIYTNPFNAETHFSKFTFKNCSDSSYRTRKSSIDYNEENLKYALDFFCKDERNLIIG